MKRTVSAEFYSIDINRLEEHDQIFTVPTGDIRIKREGLYRVMRCFAIICHFLYFMRTKIAAPRSMTSRSTPKTSVS